MRRSSRRAGVPVRVAGEAEAGKQSPQMRSAKDSSTEGSSQNDGDAIATGMMHLAIACTHVERQSDKEKKSAGKCTSLIVPPGSV